MGKHFFFPSLQGVKTAERVVLEVGNKEVKKFKLLVEGLVHLLYFVMCF
jgi:hypothetical protein